MKKIKRVVSRVKKSLTKKTTKKVDKIMTVKPTRFIIGTYVKVASLDVEAFKYTNGIRMPKQKFPRKIIGIKELFNHEKTHGYIHVYYNFNGKSGSVRSVHLPSGYEFLVASEEEVKELEADLARDAEKNLHLHLGHDMHSGSDPEIFAETGAGELLPAFAFLPGKDKKLPTPNGGGGWANMYWDGFQAEFGVNSGSCLDGLRDQIYAGLRGVFIEARKFDPKATLSAKSVVNIPDEVLQGAKEEHVAFGCTPSLNVYGMTGRQADGREVAYRPAGGHIHFGFRDNSDSKRMERCVKAMDAILGVACVALYAKFEDPRRRIMYGLAGEYRLPKHGLEYRVLSNAWLMHPTLYYLTFDLARKAFVVGDKQFLHLWKATEEETIACINGQNAEAARKILKRNKDMFCKILNSIYDFNDKSIEALFNVFIEGCESIIDNPEDIVGNWDLNEVRRVARSTWQVRQAIYSIVAKRKVA